MAKHDHKHDPELARLLGPTGYQLTCEECFERLDEYVELELEGKDADDHVPGMRTHLDGCPACHEDHESLRALVTAGEQGSDRH